MFSQPARFRAVIKKHGPNQCVEVPTSISRTFQPHARAGRIRIEGLLNSTRISATLIPVRGGGHRLFINGGMRAAAGVSLGERVTVELRPADPDDVVVPTDVAAALTGAGAKAAFAALAPSHRRELLRYIDDARTPENRHRRITKLLDHISGKVGDAKRSQLAERPLWTCPKCGNQFVNRNQYHSCRRLDLSDTFVGTPPFVRELFDRFREVVESCGPVTLVPYRDRVGFMVQVRFAGARPKKRWLDVDFWLPRRIESPRLRKIETIYPNAHVHSLRITDLRQLDDEVVGWLAEAYEVGCRRHL